MAIKKKKAPSKKPVVDHEQNYINNVQDDAHERIKIAVIISRYAENNWDIDEKIAWDLALAMMHNEQAERIEMHLEDIVAHLKAISLQLSTGISTHEES